LTRGARVIYASLTVVNYARVEGKGKEYGKEEKGIGTGIGKARHGAQTARFINNIVCDQMHCLKIII